MITDHHDGHGLTELCFIEQDEPDHEHGGASHRYIIWREIEPKVDARIPSDPDPAAFIQFQHGPRTDPRSTPGIVEGALIAVLIDRVRSFQTGPYACEENVEVAEHLEAALAALKKRADNRAARGVLGTLQK